MLWYLEVGQEVIGQDSGALVNEISAFTSEGRRASDDIARSQQPATLKKFGPQQNTSTLAAPS